MGSPALFAAAAPAAVAPAAVAGGGAGSGEAATRAPPLRGLRADTGVGPGDVVLHVPVELLMSYETAKESDLVGGVGVGVGVGGGGAGAARRK